jgi:hypothetical protein
MQRRAAIEQLADDPKANLVLQLTSACCQRLEIRCLGKAARRLQQVCLAIAQTTR